MCAGSQVLLGLLILRSFSGPFHLASSGFLAAPPWISSCCNLPFGTQGRSWRLQETGDQKASVLGSPSGSSWVSPVALSWCASLTLPSCLPQVCCVSWSMGRIMCSPCPVPTPGPSSPSLGWSSEEKSASPAPRPGTQRQ